MENGPEECQHWPEGRGMTLYGLVILKTLHQSANPPGVGGVGDSTNRIALKRTLMTKANLLEGITVDTLSLPPTDNKDYRDHSFVALVLARMTYQLQHAPDGNQVFTGAPIVNKKQMPPVKVFDGETDMEDISRVYRMYMYWKAAHLKKKPEGSNKPSHHITELPFWWTPDWRKWLRSDSRHHQLVSAFLSRSLQRIILPRELTTSQKLPRTMQCQSATRKAGVRRKKHS